MALIDSVPTSKVTVPTFLQDYQNGQLPAEIMRCPDLDRASTAQVWKMFAPVSWAMTAMQIAAKADGIAIPVGNPTALGNDNILDTTGRYRSYERQEALFLERYTTTPIEGRPTKTWNGIVWYQKPGVAMAATPGTSNHGLGLADDVAEDPDQFDGTAPVFLDDRTLTWMRDNAADFGFGLETRKERWHWHWTGGNALSQRTADVLRTAGLTIPDLTEYGFTVPPPPDTGDDEVTEDDINAIADRVYTRMMDAAEEGNNVSQAVWREKLNTANPSGVVGPQNTGSVLGWIWNAIRVVQADVKEIRAKLGA